MLQPFCPARVRTISKGGAHTALARVPQQPRRPVFPGLAVGKGDGPLEDFDAYQEAVELFDQANKLSQLQTRYELETAWQTDSPLPQGGSSPPSESAVMALLQEHGLSTREAASLFNDLYRRPGTTTSGPSASPPSKSYLPSPAASTSAIPSMAGRIQPDAQPRSAMQEHGAASAPPPPRPAAAHCRSGPSTPTTATPEQALGGPGGGPVSRSIPSVASGSFQCMSSEDARPSPRSNPLDVIPLAPTGVPRRPASGQGRQQGAPQPQPPRSTQPDEYGGCGSIPGGFTPAPRGLQDSWDDWGTASGGAPSWPGNDPLDGEQGRGDSSLGGCGTIPNQGQPGQTPPPSPFGDACAETVTPIPYNSVPRPGYQSANPGRPVAASGSTPAQGSTPPTADPGQSLGGCGDVPVWDDSLFDNIQTDDTPLPDESVFDDAYWAKARAKAQPPAPSNPAPPGAPPPSSAAPKAMPGQSLGGCGDIPVWDDSLFDQAPPPSAFQSSPDGMMTATTGGPGAGLNLEAASQSQRGTSQGPVSGSAAASAQAAPELQSSPASPSPGVTSALRDDGPLSLSQLSARLDRWQRVLPGINPARLAAVDAGLLRADVAGGLRALITLVSELPGRDVMSMLDRVPRLLWADELQARLNRCVTTLMRLHPSSDEDIVKDMVAEYPELIWRMDYYTKARLIDELPIEIQNMMIVADQGIGYTYRYYRNRRTNYLAEITSDEPFEQQT